MSAATPVLVTIPISHYCEKARWALDRAGVAYEERRHLPALHRVAVRRAGGRLTAPVLVCPEGQVVAESADIVAWADARGGRIDLGAEACTLAAVYDRDLGPATRLWVYHEMFDYPELVADAMTAGVPTWERYAYRFGNRALAFAVSKVLRINDATAIEAEKTFRSIFASVDALLDDGRPYLAGADFSIADLTFASLAAPLIAPPQYGVRLPPVEALPPGMVDVVREHRASAAGRHALRMFAEERGGSPGAD